MIGAALDAGCRQIVLGVGGSASTDGGAGMLQALGARLLDGPARRSPGGGGALARPARSTSPACTPPSGGAEFVLASDVDNPLLGPQGAAAVYGPQKGASPDDVAALDEGLRRWAAVVTAAAGREPGGRPGAGAAGGVGFAALAVLAPRSGPASTSCSS